MKKFKQFSLSIASVVVGTAAQILAQAPPANAPHQEVVKLTLHPMPIKQPALEHQLLPPLSEQVPGNAAIMYLVADSARFATPASHDQLLKVEDYLSMPLDKLPVAEAQKILDGFSNPLRMSEDAARRQDVQWDVGLREHGYETRLPYLNDMRSIARLLSLQSRVQMARGDWPAAERTLRSELGMAYQLNSQPVLIQSLVEAGIVEHLFARALWTWVSEKNSPNLFWALTSLPRPFVDLHATAQWEEAELGFTSPQLGQAVREQLPPDQYQLVLEQILPMTRLGEGPDAPGQLKDVPAEVRRLVDANQAKARQYLKTNGTPPPQVDAMSSTQAVGLYFFRQYRMMSDELWKAYELPYAQAAPSITAAEQQLKELQKDPASNPLLMTLPNALRSRSVFTRVEWQIDAMRVIEATRDYAAHHEGRPPEKLEQITEVPIPTDPFTGQQFPYRLEGQTIVIEEPGNAIQRFEITFAK